MSADAQIDIATGIDVPWQEPTQLLAPNDEALPYPIEALPIPMRGAVESYQRFGQQPIAMVACSALAAASLACQGLIDVRRDDLLVGPCSLAYLVVGNSGERKTSCDRRMRKAATGWSQQEIDDRRPRVDAAQARVAAWQARQEGLTAAIKRLAAKTSANDVDKRSELEGHLAQLKRERPHVPCLPHLFLEDVTPEALALTLANGWPSASLWSDEGGLVVGSHGMGRESALRYIALLNRLWDGQPFTQHRITRDLVEVAGRRLTASLMVQPMVVSQLLAAGDGAARGTGGLARFLIAWPSSTMGTRMYKAADLCTDALETFDNRLLTLLNQPLPIRDERSQILQPYPLAMTDKAFKLWRMFHDRIERELSSDGTYADIADVAAKAAEQAARIAAVIHAFDEGPTGRMTEVEMQAGTVLSEWHLHEARRLIGTVGRDETLSNALALLRWLQAQNSPPTPLRVLQYGPNSVRTKACRDAALACLREHGWIRETIVSGSTVIVAHPG